ncbi:UNVERIFIED_CONTAM: hypothetical protein K2H54_021897 [Gekko kuhli]
MAHTLLLFTILISAGPSLQKLQSLKSSEVVSLGGTVTISCRQSSGTISDGNYPWWAQQKEGNAPRALIYATSSRPSGVPGRFSGSRSGNTMSLTITGIQAEDEADYYCVSWIGSTFAQFVLTQTPSSSASPGETVKISCTRSSGGIRDHYVSWYQQKPGTAPKVLIYQFSNRYSGISDRFSGSTDTSANSATLTISSTQAEDEADYYCFSYAGSNQYTVVQPHGEVRQKPPFSNRLWVTVG